MQQRAHRIWNIFDEHAALMGLERLPEETNAALKVRIENIGKFMENSGRQGLINALSSALGYNQYNVLTRRIFTLTHTPYRTSTFTVTVDGATQTEITEAEYPTAAAGYIVWADEDGEYTKLIEFVDPPSFTRNATTRKHNGSKVEVTYQYKDGDRVRTYVDKCNDYDEDDDTFMGWYPEAEGSVKIHALSDKNWIDDASNGYKYSDGVPTERLKVIWRDIDAATPSTWGA